MLPGDHPSALLRMSGIRAASAPLSSRHTNSAIECAMVTCMPASGKGAAVASSSTTCTRACDQDAQKDHSNQHNVSTWSPVAFGCWGTVKSKQFRK